jgi:hypothetical protein
MKNSRDFTLFGAAADKVRLEFFGVNFACPLLQVSRQKSLIFSAL